MPPPITDIFFPLYVPVNPSMFLTVLKHTGFSRKFSAINFALKGSPGIRTVFAISPSFALLCGVGILIFFSRENPEAPFFLFFPASFNYKPDIFKII